MPAGSNISRRLTQIAIQRGVNQIFSFPKVPGAKFEDEYGEYESWDAGLFVGTNAAPDASYGVRTIGEKYHSFDFGVSSSSFTMKEYYAYKEFDFREGHTDAGMRVFEKAMQAVNQRHNIARELALKTALFTTGNWGGGTAVGAGDRFDNPASNPPGYIREQVTAIRKSAAAGAGAPLKIWMPIEVFDQLAQHPVYTQINDGSEVTGFATHDTVARSMGVEPANLIVASSVYNEQRKGETASNAFIWSDKYVWMGFCPDGVNENAQTAMAYIYHGTETPTVRRGVVDNGERHYRWMRESSIGVYQPVDTAAAVLLTGIIS